MLRMPAFLTMLAVMAALGGTALAQAAAPTLALGIGPLALPGNRTGFIMLASFRDPAGRPYAEPGTSVNLTLSGPAGWGADMVFRQLDGTDLIYATDTSRGLAAGTYTLFGTIAGAQVRATAINDGRAPAIGSIPDLRVTVDQSGRRVELNYLALAGVRLYRAEMFDETTDDFVGAGESITNRLTIEPSTPLGPSGTYYLVLFAYDIPSLRVSPAELPQRINASATATGSFGIGRPWSAAPPARRLSTLPPALQPAGW